MPPDAEHGTDPVVADDPRDVRVGAVLAVLRGAPLEAVASAWEVDAAVLPRWVSAFVDAGSAEVGNRPNPQETAERNRFLGAFAFELRAPLAEAMLSLDRLCDDELRLGDFEHAADDVRGALEQLHRRVDEAELLVSAALGTLTLDRRRVSVAALITGLGEVTLTGRGPDYELEVDAGHFGRILRDLWQASELGPTPRSRRLHAMVRGPWAELRVIREGAPIDTGVLQTLFEPFAPQGLGKATSTGLYLARALTVAHGGTIGLEQHDAGTAFWVKVPAVDQDTSWTGVRARATAASSP